MNSYGLTAEDLKMRMLTMAEDLSSFDLKELDEAFTRWRREEDIIPTAAAIRKICYAIRDSKKMANRSSFVPKTKFYQVVRRLTSAYDGELLEENYDKKNHKSRMELEDHYGFPVHIAYRPDYIKSEN